MLCMCEQSNPLVISYEIFLENQTENKMLKIIIIIWLENLNWTDGYKKHISMALIIGEEANNEKEENSAHQRHV